MNWKQLICSRLFQICAPDLSPFLVKIVDELPSSIRGSGDLVQLTTKLF